VKRSGPFAVDETLEGIFTVALLQSFGVTEDVVQPGRAGLRARTANYEVAG
jgi:hypothetical protein